MIRIRPMLLGSLSILTVSQAAVARADVTIVASATMSGSMPGQRGGSAGKTETGTTTTYFQGHKIRIESGRSVVLYDSDTKTRYLINVPNKTYSVANDLLNGMPNLAAMLDIKTKVSVVANGKTQLIAGQSAKGYSYTETVALSIKSGALPQAGAAKSGMPKAAATPMPIMVIKVEGEQWVGAVPGLAPNVGAQIVESSGISQVTKSLPGLAALSDELKNLKGYPLASQQSITMTGMGMASVGAKGGSQMSVNTKTTAIRQGPLPKALFMIPADYKRVEAPSAFPKGGRPNRPQMSL